MPYRRVLVVFAMVLLAALPALAKSNFTGEWKLNATKSDFGQMPPPSSMTQKIAHDDPRLSVAVKMASERGEFEWEANYTTDGKECTNEFRGNPSKSTLRWEGDVLVFATKGRFGDNEYMMSDKWQLSADGKTLTLNRHFSSAMGEGDQKLVLEKQ